MMLWFVVEQSCVRCCRRAGEWCESVLDVPSCCVVMCTHRGFAGVMVPSVGVQSVLLAALV
jgi:hypothetical protein